jgi:hypothetical protein
MHRAVISSKIISLKSGSGRSFRRRPGEVSEERRGNGKEKEKEMEKEKEKEKEKEEKEKEKGEGKGKEKEKGGGIPKWRQLTPALWAVSVNRNLFNLPSSLASYPSKIFCPSSSLLPSPPSSPPSSLPASIYKAP